MKTIALTVAGTIALSGFGISAAVADPTPPPWTTICPPGVVSPNCPEVGWTVLDGPGAWDTPKPHSTPKPRPVSRCHVTGGVWTVRQGETLSKIRYCTGIPVSILMRRAGITNPRFLQIGTRIEVR